MGMKNAKCYSIETAVMSHAPTATFSSSSFLQVTGDGDG